MCVKKLKRYTTSFCTEPAAVSRITVIGSTTNLSVSWRPASGQVVSYTVLLYRDSQQEEVCLSNNTVNKLFLNRKPGVLYCVVVVTKSGMFENNSSRVCNETCEHHVLKPVYSLLYVQSICTVIYMYCILTNIWFTNACDLQSSTNETIFLLLLSSQSSWPHRCGVSECGVHQLYLALSKRHGLSTVQLQCVQL